MSQARVIDGQAFAESLRGRIAEAVADLVRNHGLKPGLAVVLVGEDAASQIYVNSKGVATEAAGMLSVTRRLPAETTQADLLALVKKGA